MWSCFEDLVVRNTMVRSKFNLGEQFKIYRFFLLDPIAHGDVINFIPTYMREYVLVIVLIGFYFFQSKHLINKWACDTAQNSVRNGGKINCSYFQVMVGATITSSDE